MLKFIRGREYVIDGSPGWIYQGDEYHDKDMDEYMFFNEEVCWCYYLGGCEIDDIHEYEEEN